MAKPSQDDIDRFRTIVTDQLGLAFEDERREQLAEVLRERLREIDCDQPQAYLERLLVPVTGKAELRHLAGELTVAETYFFRHPDHFRAFIQVAVPTQLAKCRDARRPLRLLSAGCATGEEPYSLAITVRENVPNLDPREVDILGVDINPEVLRRARLGRYSEWALRGTPEETRRRYFQASGREWVLDQAIRDMVTFEERNLVEEGASFWQPGAFDVIFCRNVTMYFPIETTRLVVARLCRALAPGGFLFLGPTETLRAVSQDFHLRHSHDTFYYQSRGADEPQPHAQDPAPLPHWPAANQPAATPIQLDQSWVEAICRATEKITALANGSRPHKPVDEQPVEGPRGNGLKGSPAWDLDLITELVRQERFDEAIQALKALPPHAELDPDAKLLQAILLTNQGRVAEAEVICKQVLAIDELNAGAHYVLALCREHTGQVGAAVELDQRAVYLDPYFAMPRLHLGLLAKRSGDVRAARQELTFALHLLTREDASRILLFGGGFSRETLAALCRAELQAFGGLS